MKVIKIEEIDGIFHVTVKRNWLEKLFGFKAEEVIRYKMTLSTYKYGGGAIYIKEDGTRTNNGEYVAEEIDKWRRRF